MGIKIQGVNLTISTFREVDRRFKEAAGLAIEEGAKDMASLARAFAPVDRGDLVRSIRAQRVKDGASYKWRVKVGGVQGGRDVNAYALLVHERFEITTGGETSGEKGYNPGKRSRAKAIATGMPVGGRFLRRAYDAHKDNVIKKIRLGLRGASNAVRRKR